VRRVAVVSDVHANVPVLAEIDAVGVDLVVSYGERKRWSRPSTNGCDQRFHGTPHGRQS
jgi:hypothetical protein